MPRGLTVEVLVVRDHLIGFIVFVCLCLAVVGMPYARMWTPRRHNQQETVVDGSRDRGLHGKARVKARRRG